MGLAANSIIQNQTAGWKRTLATLLISIASLTPLASAAQSVEAVTPAQPPIRIGLSGPFSGGSAPLGESMRNGVRLAVEEINSVGGIYGRRIQLIERDDQAKNDIGAAVANELIKQKVVATIGIVNTGVGLASIDIYQKAKIPLMIAVSTGTSLTKKFAAPAAPANYIFRVAQTIDLEVKKLVTTLSRANLTEIALLADSTAYGDAGVAAFQRIAAEQDIKITSVERFAIGDTDMSKQLRKARDGGALAVVAWGIGPELAALTRSKAALGWNVPLLGSWTLSMQSFIDGVGRAGDGVLMPQTFIPNLTRTINSGFLLAYRRAFGAGKIPSISSAAQGYDGMFLLYHALRQANSTDGDKVRVALENLRFRYQGVLTSYHEPFSASDHEAVTLNMLLMGKIRDGRIVYAGLEDEKSGALLRMKTPALQSK